MHFSDIIPFEQLDHALTRDLEISGLPFCRNSIVLKVCKTRACKISSITIQCPPIVSKYYWNTTMNTTTQMDPFNDTEIITCRAPIIFLTIDIPDTAPSVPPWAVNCNSAHMPEGPSIVILKDEMAPFEGKN